jgi:hypothetical protein
MQREARTSSVGVTLGLFIATLLLTRQTQIPLLEGLAAVWALVLLTFHLRWRRPLLIAGPMVVYGLCSTLVSLAAGREPAAIIRFFVITMCTLLAFHARPVKISLPWALLPVTLQAVAIATVSVTLGWLQDPALALAVRDHALDMNWGDIYSFDGLYYRVQLIGNALLPLLFMIALWRWRWGRIYQVMTILSLAGLVAAGNLTYFLVAAIAVLLAHGRRLRRSVGARVVIIFAMPLLLAAGWGVVNEAVSDKFDGSDSSMGVRFDQLDAAQRQVGDAPLRLVFGTGLGARFPDGQQRNYSQDRYIEMQWLYLSLQLGMLGLLIYAATLWLSARHFLDRDGRSIFWLYMLAGCTNPYILDSNQIIATIILVCAFPRQSSDAGTDGDPVLDRGRSLPTVDRSKRAPSL